MCTLHNVYYLLFLIFNTTNYLPIHGPPGLVPQKFLRPPRISTYIVRKGRRSCEGAEEAAALRGSSSPNGKAEGGLELACFH